MVGRHVDMGPCTVVRTGATTVLLTSRRTPPFDLGQWRSQGIDPERLTVIGVKAAVAHRRAYDPIARASWTVSVPGPCTSDVRSLPYRLLRRPCWPWDEVEG
jgi:microcystin degradation protein MlrC